MYELKTNTAVRIAVGPLVDPTDGKTAETALTVTGMTVDILQMDNDGTAVNRTSFSPTASGGNNDMVHVTDDAVGMYDLELTAAQINFLGNARLVFYDVDGFLVHWIDIQVVSAAYFDWKYGTNLPNVNVTQISGDSTAADNCERFFDGTGYAGTNNVIPTVTTLTGHTPQTGDAYAIVNDGTYGNNALKTLIDTVDNFVDTEVAAIKVVTDKLNGMTEMDLGESYYRWTDTALEAAPGTDPWATALPGAYGAGTAGKIVGDNINAPIATVDTVVDGLATELAKVPKSDSTVTWNATALASIQTECTDALNAYDPPTKAEMDSAFSTTNGKIDAVDDYVDTEVAAIKTVTDKLDTALELDVAVYRFTTNALEQAPTGGSAPTAAAIADAVWDEALSGHTGAGSAGEALDAAGTAGDPWLTALPGSYGAGTAGKIIGDNINAPIATVDTVVDAIKAKTDNLPDSPAAVGSPMTLTSDYDAAKTASSQTSVNTVDGIVDDIIVDTGTTIPATLTTIEGKIDAIAPGAGAIEWTYTVATSGGVPISGVSVWCTSDVAGTVVLQSGTTNASGVVTFWLAAGTVYVWCYKEGYNFTNPDVETVS